MSGYASRNSTAAAILVLAVFGTAPAQADDFDQWSEQQAQAFADWMSEQDRAFAEKLARDWRAFERFRGRTRDPEPKPPRQPQITADIATVTEPLPAPEPTEVAGPTFLGHALNPPRGWDHSAALAAEPDPDSIATAYQRLLAADPRELVGWLRARSEDWRLGDWGQIKLVHAVVEDMNVVPRVQPLLAWFLLLRLDHDVRIGYGDSGFALLVTARQTVYELPYYKAEGRFYYDLFQTAGGGRLFSYAEQHAAVDPLDMAPRQHPRTRPEPAEATLEAEGHRMPLEYDLRLARYYRDHPQLDLDHFLTAPLDGLLADSAGRYWREQGMEKRPPLEQINLLLAMVQNLPYETDQDQFGVEKYMLPEEIFTHAASDCDDRTLLFSALTRHLVGVDIVNLGYPGHVATAVRVDGEGDRFVHDGRSYLVADPTYVGATAGMTMPRYRDSRPAIVGL